jgi:hypothetical protein
MSYESNPADLTPSNLERLLDSQFVWLLLSFLLLTDIGLSKYCNMPLVYLSLKNFESSVNVGSILIFLGFFGVFQILSWKIESLFRQITWPVIYPILSLVNKDEESLGQFCVKEVELKMFIFLNDHQVLHEVYKDFLANKRRENNKLILLFQIGILLLCIPFLSTSSLHILLINPFSINIRLISFLGLILLFWGAYKPSFTKYNNWIYVGRKMKMKINEFLYPNAESINMARTVRR